MRVTKTQVLNALAMASAIAVPVAGAVQAQHVNLPAWAWTVLTVVAGLSRSVLPALSGQAGVDKRAGAPAGAPAGGG